MNVNSAEHSLDADLPFACMIYILGKFRAGGLRYVDSYAIHPSLMQNDKQKRLGEHTFAWMVYQYYQYFDRSTVQRKEIISFLENCVQMSYLTASRFVLSMVRAGLLEGEYGDDRFYTIKRPQGKQLKIFINNRWKNNDYSLN